MLTQHLLSNRENKNLKRFCVDGKCVCANVERLRVCVTQFLKMNWSGCLRFGGGGGLLQLFTTIILPNQPVRDQWEYPRKMERHFPIKPGQPVGMALATFYSFLNSLIRAKNRFVKNGTAKTETDLSI